MTSEPHVRLPSLRVWQQEEEPQSIWLGRPEELECRSSTGLEETETPLLEDAHKISHALVPAQSSDSIGAWARPTCGSWRVSWGGGSWLWLTVGAGTLVVEVPGNVDWCELSQRSPFWHQDLAPPNSLQAPVLGRLRPNNQWDGGENTAPPISRQAA